MRIMSRRLRGFVAVTGAGVVLAISAGGVFGAVGDLTVVGDKTHLVGDVTAMDGPNDMAISPNGQNVYVTAAQSDGISVFSRNAGNGALTFVESEVNANGTNELDSANDVAVSPDGLYVYATSGTQHTVVVYDRDTGTGALTFHSFRKDGVGVNTLGGADGVAVSPDSGTVYVAGSNDGSITAFDVQPNGLLSFQDSETDGDPGPPVVDGLNDVNDVVVAPDGENVYTTSSGTDNAITTFDRAANGNLTFNETDEDTAMTFFAGPIGLDVSNDNAHVYAAAALEDSLTTWTRAADGKLTLSQTLRDGMTAMGLDGAWDVDAAPDGANVYAVGADDNAIALFSRNSGTGSLTYTSNAGAAAGPRSVVVSPDSKHVFATASTDDNLRIWSRELLAPMNTANPDVTGPDDVKGTTFTCGNGGWNGVPAPTFTRQWRRDGTDILGQTGLTYITGDVDVGTAIDCRVTATNSAGAANQLSNAITVTEAPANLTAPVVTGPVVVGGTLSCSDGTWDAFPAPGFTREWLRNGVAIVPAEIGLTYTTVAADVGTNISCRVTANNGEGVPDDATSNAIAVTAAPVSPAEPTPTARQDFNVKPVSGLATYTCPGQGTQALTKLQNLPLGCTLNATAGRVTLTTAKEDGTTQTADFYEGQFKVTQGVGKLAGTKAKGLLTTLTLTGPPVCPKGKKGSIAHVARGGRRLWGSGRGGYRTRGGRSAATVRGTTWLTKDSCKGTLTKVTEGSVEVDDFGKKKNKIVTAPGSYMAKAAPKKK